VTATTWWLDVETKNTWSPDPVANSRVIQGAADALHAAGKTVGVYCTPYQWGIITDRYFLGIPVWAAGAPPDDPSSYCTAAKSVGGGPVWLAQYTIEPVDYDLAC
jgi:GH25 family lysozyme M1 (1,4-beta-N-acetylmuramidase)